MREIEQKNNIDQKIESLINRALDEIAQQERINTNELKNIVSAFRTWDKDKQYTGGDVYIIDNIPDNIPRE